MNIFESIIPQRKSQQSNGSSIILLLIFDLPSRVPYNVL